MFDTEQAFAVKIGIGLAIGGWFIIWSAHQHGHFKRWLDVYLGTILGGIIGARIVYILLNLGFFVDEPLNIPRLWFAELTWQGAVLGGLLAMGVICRWRNVSFADFSDGMALALPVGLIAVCWAARSAGIILGKEPPNLDNLPVWAAAFLPDLNRYVAPRYELQMLGVGFGAVILLIAGILTLSNRLTHRRLWATLALMAGAIFVLSRFSAYPEQQIYGVPLQQSSVLILIIFSLSMVIKSVNRTESAVSAPIQDKL